jgi:hypothetical protein
VVNPNLTVSVYVDPSILPYDYLTAPSPDDSLVGVQNNSNQTVTSLNLQGNGIFTFDYTPGGSDPPLCTFGVGNCQTGYEGPGVTFSSFGSGNSGYVQFSQGIAPGGSAWFGLEGAPSIVGLVTVSPSSNCPTAGATAGTAYGFQLTGIGGAGAGSYSWTVAQGSLPSGLTVTPAGLVSGTPGVVQVTSFTLQIKDSAGAIGQQTCSITVGAAPPASGIAVSTSSLNFTSAQGIVGASQQFTVKTAGPPISYSVAVSQTSPAPVTWVSVSPSLGTATGANPGVVTVSFTNAATSLTTGTYTATVTLTPTNGASPQFVAITNRVVTNHIFATTPLNNNGGAVLVFGSLLTAPLPPAQNVNLTTVSGTLAYTVGVKYAAPPAVNWLLPASSNGSAPGVLGVSIQPLGLAAGTYIGFVTPNVGGADQDTVTVYLVVEAAPDALRTFSYQQGGALPATTAAHITGTTAGLPLVFGVTSPGNWLSVRTDSFQTAANLTMAVEASSSQATGASTGAVFVGSFDPANGPEVTIITCVLTVQPPPPVTRPPGPQNFQQLGLFRSQGGLGVFALDVDENYNYESADRSLYFGLAGDRPVAGDWLGSGVVSLGVFRCPPAGVCQFYIDLNNNGKWDGVAGGDAIWNFGISGDMPIVGDWTGDGITKLGIMRCPTLGVCTWYLDFGNKHTYDPATVRIINFGLTGDLPVVNNWNGTSNADQIGIFRCPPVPGPCYWHVDTLGNGTDTAQYQYGVTGDQPIVGNWNGTGRKRIGIFRGGQIILNQSGSNSFTLGSDFMAPPAGVGFGLPGDLPVIGFWNMP